MTRTMFAVNIDRSDPVPLHDQVAARIRRAIADGEAGPGEEVGGFRGSENIVAAKLHRLMYRDMLRSRELSDRMFALNRQGRAAGPGERLPLAKDLAAVLGVNKNTVLRALHLLREEGLLEFRRGRGITVVGTPQRGAVLARTRELVEFARLHGFGREEIIQLIQSLP